VVGFVWQYELNIGTLSGKGFTELVARYTKAAAVVGR
jgi:hypothetical protein